MRLTSDAIARFVNRRAVYREGGRYCVVRVEKAEAVEDGMTAELATDADVVYYAPTARGRYLDVERPFPDHWTVGAAWECFYYSPPPTPGTSARTRRFR